MGWPLALAGCNALSGCEAMSDWVWVIWIAVIAVSFSVLEYWGILHGNRTLSKFIRGLGQKWPLSLVVYGALFGGLAIHFYASRCPPL